MSAPIWSDERIKRQAITNCCYINNVVKGLTEMRDEYEATLAVAYEIANQQCTIRYMDELDAARNRIAELESFDAASKVTIEKMAMYITELEAQLAAARAERAIWYNVGMPAEHSRENH